MSTKVSTDLIDLSGNTGGLVWAKGPTTDQPASATAGEMRVDTTTATTVVYTGAQWKTLKEIAVFTPSDNFNTVLYDGNGSTQSITGVGFQPDLVWVKNRLTSAENHLLSDVASGFGKILFSNLTNAQVGSDNTYFSQLSNGFSINTNNGNISGTNNYVAWSWKAGGAAVIGAGTGVTNVLVSANTAAGFSIVKFTGGSGSGETVKTGLNSETEIYFLKGLDNGADSWIVCGNSAIFSSPTTNFLRLNTTNSVGSTTAGSVGSNGDDINVGVRSYNGQETIAYCFHSVAGYSKIGSYTGNGSATGPIVTLGFEPAWVMIKRTDSTGAWSIFDNKRDPSNPVQKVLQAQTNAAEANVGNACNFNSNDFQLTDTNSQRNANGGTYIFMAFATNPT